MTLSWASCLEDNEYSKYRVQFVDLPFLGINEEILDFKIEKKKRKKIGFIF